MLLICWPKICNLTVVIRIGPNKMFSPKFPKNLLINYLSQVLLLRTPVFESFEPNSCLLSVWTRCCVNLCFTVKLFICCQAHNSFVATRPVNPPRRGNTSWARDYLHIWAHSNSKWLLLFTTFSKLVWPNITDTRLPKHLCHTFYLVIADFHHLFGHKIFESLLDYTLYIYFQN